MNANLPFKISAKTIHGKRLGSTLGFPTANLSYPPIDSLPQNGVYVALAVVDGKEYISILNQGSHPTSPKGAPTIETHLLNYKGGDLYDKDIELTYLHYIREEKKFPSLRALKHQLKSDVKFAKKWYASSKETLSSLQGNQANLQLKYTYPLQTKDVFFSYEDDSENAVNDVTLNIEPGSMVAILGHNGSGKSTLAKLMNALYTPKKGTILVCGLDTKQEEHIWDVRKHAGMVFQNPDNQIVATVVREDVAFGLENLGVNHQEMVQRIDKALEDVHMTKYAASAPHMLSGGQKQRVAVAGVLAMQPEVMIMDEVTAMLDPSGREDVFETVSALNKQHGITVIWITHFMQEAALCDRIVVLDHGKIELDGKAKDVFTQVEKLKKLGLDVPPMAELATMLQNEGIDLPQGILTVDDMQEELTKWLSK